MLLLLVGRVALAACVAVSDGAHDFQVCTDDRSWPDAQAACAALGAHLADVDDATENAWLWAQAEAADAGTGWWFGLSDRATEGSFAWDGGATASYTNWRAGEPNDFGGDEDCARWPDNGAGVWADADCDTPQPYICESGCLYESAFTDADGDGWGDPATETRQCGIPTGTVPVAGDCDDADGAISPDAREVCGGGDDDCDGLVDEADPDCDLSAGVWAWADGDGDGWGAGEAWVACSIPEGAAALDGDCDDGDAAAFPGAVEVPADGVDQDCDGADLCLVPVDADGDGWGHPTERVDDCDGGPGTAANSLDCDDGDASVHPEAPETWYDGVDQDCDGGSDHDQDGDGVDAGADCDDLDPTVAPGADETCDARDQDCDGAVDEDARDCDGCLATQEDERLYLVCPERVSWAEAAARCRDRGYTLLDVIDATENAEVYAQAFALDDRAGAWMGLVDLQTEGVYRWESGASFGYAAWGDGEPSAFVATEDCVAFADDAAAVWQDTDCAEARPYVCELGCLATTTYLDADGDGFGDPDTAAQECATGEGRVVVGGDCDDGDPGRSPGVPEGCDPDDTDEDCDGLADDADDEAAGGTLWYLDQDGDGYGIGAEVRTACDAATGWAAVAGDCDDTDAGTHPGAGEALDGVDNDCNGATEAEDLDGDGLSDVLEALFGCDPSEVDSDGDGWLDGAEAVLDGGAPADGDGDGVPDCADADPTGCGCAAVGASPGAAGGALGGALLLALAGRRRRPS